MLVKHPGANFKIRKAQLQDAETLTRYNLLLAKETEDRDLDPDTVYRGIKAIIKDPHKGFYLVAVQADEIIGQLMVTNSWCNWRNKNILWIHRVYVPMEHRNKGIFKALFHRLEEMARYRKDVAGLRLYVEPNNQKAMTTYEKLGMITPGYKIYEILF